MSWIHCPLCDYRTHYSESTDRSSRDALLAHLQRKAHGLAYLSAKQIVQAVEPNDVAVSAARMTTRHHRSLEKLGS